MTSTWGEKAKRDIVQFVPFREFRNKPISELAKCVLEEVFFFFPFFFFFFYFLFSLFLGSRTAVELL
jgi:hypothetical protein